MFIASLFIIIGVAYLLKNLGIITGNIWGIIWPLILIAFGLYLAQKSFQVRLFWNRIWKKLK